MKRDRITCDVRDEPPDLTVMAFGGGVQSTALLVMIGLQDDRLDGWELPRYAVFADPGSEHERTYAHIWRCAEWADERGVEVRMTSTERRLVDALLEDQRFASIPAYTLIEGSKGILNRNCTADHKVVPLAREYRRLLVANGTPRGKVDVWMGISLDEIQRVKPSGSKWQRRVHPLIDLGMRRGDCLNYLAASGWPDVPKSACVFCPFHSASAWVELAREDGAAWAEVVRVDEAIRDMNGRGGVKGALYLHGSCRPIKEVSLDLLAQGDLLGENVWDNECTGLCGV